MDSLELLRIAVLWHEPELNDFIEEKRCEEKRWIDEVISVELKILEYIDSDFIKMITE